MNIKRVRDNEAKCFERFRWALKDSESEKLWLGRYDLFRQEYERRLEEISLREDKERKERFERNELTRLFKKYLNEHGASTIYTVATIDWSRIDWGKTYGKAK